MGLRGTQLTRSINYTLVSELFQSRAEGKVLGEWETASPTCLIGSTVNTIQKQRSIHNHCGSLAVIGNGQGLLPDGNPPVRASARGFKLEGGENWGKVKRLGKTEYN
jgi:hypothetical protein